MVATAAAWAGIASAVAVYHEVQAHETWAPLAGAVRGEEVLPAPVAHGVLRVWEAAATVDVVVATVAVECEVAVECAAAAAGDNGRSFLRERK